MRSDSSRPRSVAVLLFEAIDPPPLKPVLRSTPRPQLPLYVEPIQDEALLSWLLRLSSRLQVSLHTLASQSFGINDRSIHTHWWCRPDPWTLTRISERTGVPAVRLRPMTFAGLAANYRDDEASARLTGRRYDSRGREPRGCRFALCGPCIAEGSTPYLRLQWLLGWLAICPKHKTVLIERCTCGARLRVAPFTTDLLSFSPSTCTRCGANLLGGEPLPAHPSALSVQNALLRAKREGAGELDGLGVLTWPQMVALVDVLLGMLWTDLTLAEQEEIFGLYISQTGDSRSDEDGIYDGRHGSLRFLAWLTEGWPDSPGATVSRGLLARWLAAERNRLCRHLRADAADPWTLGPTNFEPTVAKRLKDLAGV
jgi:hypothetical protein